MLRTGLRYEWPIVPIALLCKVLRVKISSLTMVMEAHFQRRALATDRGLFAPGSVAYNTKLS